MRLGITNHSLTTRLDMKKKTYLHSSYAPPFFLLLVKL